MTQLQASLTPMPMRKIPETEQSEWFPQALVLLVEERTCRCCYRVYSVPNPCLMVRAINPLYPTARDRFVKKSLWHGDTRDLPHERHIEYTSCDRCPGCFEADPMGQLIMFPKPIPSRPTFAQVMAQKRLEALDEAALRDKKRINGTATKLPSVKQVEKMRKSEAAKKIAKNLFGDL